MVSLSVTFASFLIAFSFMIGTAASNLVSAVLFIFVSRLYDVGDRVHIYNSSMTKGEEPTNVTVVKVDLMTTVFKRWDEQVCLLVCRCVCVSSQSASTALASCCCLMAL